MCPAASGRFLGAAILACLLGCGQEGDEGRAHVPPQQQGAPKPPRRPPLAPALRPAASAIDAGRFDEARQLLEAELAVHPDDAQAMFLLGISYYRTENYGAASPWLERALERMPELDLAHEPLGRCLLLVGELERARGEYEAVVAHVPGDPLGPYGLGLIELEETHLDAAAEHFGRAIGLFQELEKSDPRQAAARVNELAECHARLGEVLFAEGDYQAARAQLMLATTLWPGNISAFYTLSLVHRRMGDEALADEAAAKYESARQALLARQKAAGR